MNGALVAGGSPVTLQSFADGFQSIFSTKTQENPYSTGPISQTADILITSRGYAPNYIRVKKGLPVTIKLTSKDAYSCASAFRIPSLGISKNLQANETQVITFTPEEAGNISFSCAMGMYRGVIEVL